MVRKYCFIMVLFLSTGVWSQPTRSEASARYLDPGKLAASATFSPSTMLNQTANNYYLSAFAEYHLDERLSLRSDNYLFLNAEEEVPFVHQAFRTYFGAFYHFRQSSSPNWDKYIGFQPGITIIEKSRVEDDLPPTESSVRPSFSIAVGTSYYVWKYFHFFANVAYVHSNLGAVTGGPYRTDELIFSAGLGFQIQTKNEKRN